MTTPADYPSYLDQLHSRCMDYPAVVSIETFAYCNAACDFCPYPNLIRKGDKMPDALIDKLIADLEEIPADHAFEINLSRVNEPFLDARIYDIATRITERLTGASLVFFSNGTPLNTGNIEKLSRLRRVARLNISVNEFEADAYEKSMQLPLEKTLDVLRNLHRGVADGHLSFPIALSRVGDGSTTDQIFVSWVKENFPAFAAVVSPRSDWMGLVPQPGALIPDQGCTQWYKLHILADGRDAYCCIDAEGQWSTANARETSLLNIYNQPARRRLRLDRLSRQGMPICGQCPLLS
ncbi:MAG: radical SAM protein [Sulfuritalea sp.]|jgi:hypothetical protein|nr:radical SAM protein [Sulfuritalea sp.]